MKTFAIGFPDPNYDETRYAELAARHLGTEHQTFIVEPKAWETLPELAWQFDEPFADSSALPTWYVSRETRRHVTVALTGDAGDELFGGYDRYRALGADRAVPAPARRPAALARRDDGPRLAAFGPVEEPAPQAPAALRAHQRAGRGSLPGLDDDLRRSRSDRRSIPTISSTGWPRPQPPLSDPAEADPAAILASAFRPGFRAATRSRAPWSRTS